MPSFSIQTSESRQASREWVRRKPGRRATDRRLTLERVMIAVGVLAWIWCGYELVRLFVG